MTLCLTARLYVFAGARWPSACRHDIVSAGASAAVSGIYRTMRPITAVSRWYPSTWRSRCRPTRPNSTPSSPLWWWALFVMPPPQQCGALSEAAVRQSVYRYVPWPYSYKWHFGAIVLTLIRRKPYAGAWKSTPTEHVNGSGRKLGELFTELYKKLFRPQTYVWSIAISVSVCNVL